MTEYKILCRGMDNKWNIKSIESEIEVVVNSIKNSLENGYDVYVEQMESE